MPPVGGPVDTIKKFRLASELFDFAYQIKKHQLRLRYPLLSEKELHEKTMELIEAGSR